MAHDSFVSLLCSVDPHLNASSVAESNVVDESMNDTILDGDEEDEYDVYEECDDVEDNADHNLGGILSNVNDVQSSSLVGTHNRGQWNIPGAIYQARFPIEQLSLEYESTHETLRVGALFNSKDSLKVSLGLYELYNRVESVVIKSDKKRYIAHCKHKDQCSFHIRATSFGDTWRVTKWVQPHKCQLDFTLRGPRTVSAMVIGAYFSSRLLCDGAVLKPKEMQAELQRLVGVEVDYSLALSGRNHAIAMVYGDMDKSFGMLPSYLYMVRKANPGTIVDLKTDKDGRFKYAYMSIGACIYGFRACGRPVIVVDATHLKGKYKGVMFVAATKDGNEQIFPLAVGIGDVENDESWTWFLSLIRRTFENPANLLFVSDQHRSIKNAINTVYPGIPHGLCTYHLQCNLKHWGANVVSIFQEAANAYCTKEFDKHMNCMLVASANGAYKKLLELDPSRWARSKCSVRRYRFMTSNCAESLNGRLRWTRRLPICTLLECVRTLIGEWFDERRSIASLRNNELTDYAAKKVGKAWENDRSLIVVTIS